MNWKYITTVIGDTSFAGFGNSGFIIDARKLNFRRIVFQLELKQQFADSFNPCLFVQIGGLNVTLMAYSCYGFV